MTDQERQVKGWRRFTMLEPPLMLFSFSTAMTATVFTDLVMYRTCLFTLNMNDSDCLMLRNPLNTSEAAALESKVQPYASHIIMVKSVIECTLPALLSLFFGPWSDRHGRRPLFLAGGTGFVLMYALLALMCNLNIDPWWLLICFTPIAVFGGYCIVVLAAICFVSDSIEEENRTLKLAYLETAISIGVLLGIFVGPAIYKAYSYTAVFSSATACSLAATLHIFLVIPETVQRSSQESGNRFFKLSFVSDLLNSCIKKRNGFNRSVVWLVTLVILLYVLIIQGENTVDFLFTRERLGWDVQRFSYYSATAVILSITGILLGVRVLGRILGISDTSLCMLACVTCLMASIMKALSVHAWQIYLSRGLGMLGGIIGPVNRSILSNSVPSQDIGKVFSLITSMEVLMPLGASPLYTLIYSHYLPPIYPSPVFLLSASIYGLMAFIVISIIILIGRSSHEILHVPLPDEVE